MKLAVERVRRHIDGEAGFGLVEALLAAIILAFGLLYAWKKGVLKWR